MNISRRAVLFNSLIMAGCNRTCAFGNDSVKSNTMNDENTRSFFKLYPVGRIERKGKSVSLHIFKKYKDALMGYSNNGVNNRPAFLILSRFFNWTFYCIVSRWWIDTHRYYSKILGIFTIAFGEIL